MAENSTRKSQPSKLEKTTEFIRQLERIPKDPFLLALYAANAPKDIDLGPLYAMIAHAAENYQRDGGKNEVLKQLEEDYMDRYNNLV